MRRTTLFAVSSLTLALAACTGKQDSDTTANAPSAAKEVELIPREALFGNPERAAVQISPDGKYLSWIAPVDGPSAWAAGCSRSART